MSLEGPLRNTKPQISSLSYLHSGICAGASRGRNGPSGPHQAPRWPKGHRAPTEEAGPQIPLPRWILGNHIRKEGIGYRKEGQVPPDQDGGRCNMALPPRDEWTVDPTRRWARGKARSILPRGRSRQWGRATRLGSGPSGRRRDSSLLRPQEIRHYGLLSDESGVRAQALVTLRPGTHSRSSDSLGTG